MEASGQSQWFERMLAELGHEVWIGDAGKIRASCERKQKTDRRDAELLMRLLAEDRWIWVPTAAERDARQLFLHRHKLVRMRTQKNQLQALALNQGVQRKRKLWSEAGRAEFQNRRPATYRRVAGLSQRVAVSDPCATHSRTRMFARSGYMSKTAVAQVNATDLRMFARLGIPAELLAQARVRRVTDSEAREEFGIRGDGNMDGIIFPYFDPSTRSRVTTRLRRDTPEIVEGKPKRKYVCPYGDRRLLYFPPGATDLLADPRVPIVLVKAEKSSLALTAWAERRARRIVAVALGGAWSWRAKTGKTSNANGKRVDETGPTPGLQYASNGRKTFVLLDANAATNEDVQYARSKLVQQLNKQVAGVVVLDLPSIPGVNGPDDFIALRGDEAMASVFEWKPQACGSGTVDWRDPKPIQAELRPDALRSWVMDEADRMPCAPDFVAAAATVALGTIIGARCAIKPKAKDDWLVVPNLWGGLVGLPSAKKSPAIGAALKPLDRLIAQAIEAHKTNLEAFEAGKTAFEARKEALEHRIKAAAKAKGGKAEDLEDVSGN